MKVYATFCDEVSRQEKECIGWQVGRGDERCVADDQQQERRRLEARLEAPSTEVESVESP